VGLWKTQIDNFSLFFVLLGEELKVADPSGMLTLDD
jgi:hypothetical protein